MMKKLHLMIALGATTFSFAQWTQNFEGAAPTFVTRGAPAYVAEVAVNPVKTGINTTDNALKITLTTGAQYFKWAGLQNPGGTYNDVNGKFIKFKFLSVNETTVKIQLEPWFDGVVNTTIPEQTFSGLALNTWYEVEFDYTAALAANPTGYCTRLDIKLNVTNNVNYDGDIFYVDEMLQGTSATLSTNSIELKSVGVYPNPTSDILTINTTENFKSVQIIDLLGKTVRTFNDTKVLSISDLNNGVYILETDTGLKAKFIKN